MMHAASSFRGHSAQDEFSGPEHREHSADHLLWFPSHVSLGRRRPEDVALVLLQGQSDLDGSVTCKDHELPVLEREI